MDAQRLRVPERAFWDRGNSQGLHIDGVNLFCFNLAHVKILRTVALAPVPSPLTPSVIRLSHQLIKPGEFTPLAMLGPAVSP